MYNTSILIAGDNDETTISLVSALRSECLNVSVCPKNGAALLSAVEEVEPDVVVMDMFMHHIDVWGVMSRINMQDPIKRPLIIVISNINNSCFEKDLLKCGVDYCFFKPVYIPTFKQIITQLISAKGNEAYTVIDEQWELDVIISDYLHRAGVKTNKKGYYYLRMAIRLSVENPEMLKGVMKFMYPTIGKSFKCSGASVERAVRYAIDTAWDKGNSEFFKENFSRGGYTPSEKPTNTEFITRIAEEVIVKRRQGVYIKKKTVYK